MRQFVLSSTMALAVAASAGAWCPVESPARSKVKVVAAPVQVIPAPAMPPADAGSPADADPSVEADRVLFDRLISDVRQLDLKTDELLSEAMARARDDYGRLDLATKARLLSLRDQRDRLHSRLLLLSARHGWDLPRLVPRPIPIATARESFDSVFGAADAMVHRELAGQARRIVISVRLPVVSLEVTAK